MDIQRSERGQALVIIVLSVVAMFAFVALAVYGGRLFAERRRTQSAADAAAIAAAYTSINTKDDPYAAGYNSANENGFNNDGVTNTVAIYNPPASGPYADNPEYFQVIIWERFNPIFAQFIFADLQQVTTEAVAHAQNVKSVSEGNAIHSLSTSCSGKDYSMDLDGNVNLQIIGGNMFSNGCWKKNGGSGEVLVTKGTKPRDVGIKVVGGIDCNGCKPGKTVVPDPQTVDKPEFVGDIPIPYCPDKGIAHETKQYVGSSPDGTPIYYDPVDYYNDNGADLSGTVHLPPGVHCITGDISKGNLSGEDVLLVLLDGGIKMTGGDTIDLTRDNDLVDFHGVQYGGMLIYALPGNTSKITLGGNSNNYFTGSIYAPSSTCDIGGTAYGKTSRGNVVCYKIKTHGTADVKIIYEEEENFHFPPMLELSQ